VHERLPDQHAPLHAAGERPHVRVGFRGQVEVMQQFIDPVAGVAQAEVARLDRQRLAHGEEGIEHELLRNDAEQSSRVPVIGHDVVSQNTRYAGVGARQPGEDGDERGFARAIGSQQPEEFAGPDHEIHADERLHLAEAAGDADDLDGRSHAATGR